MALSGSEGNGRDPGATLVRLVDEDRRHPSRRVEWRGEATEVPAVTDREEREHADRGVFGRVQASR